MSRVLVTGASGFVGGQLASELVRQQQQVRCLVRPTSDVSHLELLGVELFWGDLSTSTCWRSALKGVGCVYHVAGKTAALHRSELIRVNARGTHLVAEACARQLSPPTLMLMSSLAAAGPSRDEQPKLESDPARPISDYGRSKRGAELAAESWADELPVTVVRPGIVYGPRNREMLPIFQSVIRFGVHAVPGLRRPRVSLIYVDDLAEIAIRAAQAGSRIAASGPRHSGCGEGYYFACAPDPPPYADLGRIIAQASGRRSALTVCLPGPIPWMVAAASQLAARLRGRADSLNLDKMREATAGSWIGSDRKVATELGFTPPLPLGERMRQTVEWYRRSGWL